MNDQPSDKHSQVHPNLEHITSTNSKVDLSDSGENNQVNEIDKDIAQVCPNDELVNANADAEGVVSSEQQALTLTLKA